MLGIDDTQFPGSLVHNNRKAAQLIATQNLGPLHHHLVHPRRSQTPMTAPKNHVATSRGAGQALPTRTGESRAERGVVYRTDRASTQEEMLARLYQIARTETPSF